MPTIPTSPPTPYPQRGDRATFRLRVDAFISWFVVVVPQLGELITWFTENFARADATLSQHTTRLSLIEASVPATGGITIGGVNKTAWPTVTTGANGNVILTGSVTLAGSSGVTVTHNRGSAAYLIKLSLTGNRPQDAGEISYVKAANTCVIYNSGISGIVADFELSATA